MIILVALLTLSANEVPEYIDVTLPSGPHPYVFLTPGEVEQVRIRVKEYEWAKSIAKAALQSADTKAREDFVIPRREGQWSHWYTCKEDGGGLKAKSATEHVCSVCGKVYSGWPYDEVYYGRQHSHALGSISNLGIGYVLEPKPEYAEKVRAILLEYASFYTDLRLHNVKGKESAKGARLKAQTLDEAVMMCNICLGYDMVYDASCFSDEDHRVIEERFLRPMVETIKRNRAGRSNWQSWHNAAIASAGFLLRDAEYIDLALNDPGHGFLYQMRESVFPSGMWYEGAPSYHWYALTSHMYLLEASTRAGIDLYGIPIVKRMFSGPVRQLFPDGTFPAVNDSSRGSISGARRYYEVAYRRYGDPSFASLLQMRTDPWAMLWGADAVPSVDGTIPLATSNEDSEGLAILRDETNETAVFFNYAHQRGGHTHPAKLDLVLYAHGDERIVDPGRLPYGNPIHRGWYWQTIAHNTVVVNETTQNHADCELAMFEAIEGHGGVVRATTNQAYKGVVLDRTLALYDTIVIDVVRCTGSEEVVFDLPTHFRGELVDVSDGDVLEAMAPVPGRGRESGYDYLKDVMLLAEPGQPIVVRTGDAGKIHAEFSGHDEMFVAKGFGKNPSELLPVVIRRQRGHEAVFVSVYQILRAEDEPSPVACSLDGDIVVTAALPGSDGTVELKVGDETHFTPPAQ